MPEFCLNRPARPAHPFYGLDTFARGYVEAMFFTNGDTADENENLLNELGAERLTRAAVAKIAADCAAFQKAAAPILALAYEAPFAYDEEQAGRDFWFTRQGHGVGFADRINEEGLGRDLGEMPDGELIAGTEAEEAGAECIGTLADHLTEAAEAMGESYVETSRGWIYVR